MGLQCLSMPLWHATSVQNFRIFTVCFVSKGFIWKFCICSLMVNMLNAPKEVRAASLRVMKHLIVDEESLELFLDLHLDYIVARYVFRL